MNCAREWIEAYLDEELDAQRRAEVAGHLATCAACAELHSRLQSQRDAIRSFAPRYNAPAALRQSIRQSLRRESSAAAFPWRGLAIAASVLLAVSLAWNLTQPGRPSTLVADVLSSHVRSMMENHLLDVASTDQHTVKPWFDGRLDFSPQVRDLASEGFPLAGGRVDYLAGRTVAALVYHRRKHIINVFTWPGDSAGPRQSARNGYGMAHWQQGGMTWWAVSDIPMSELEQFAALLRR